MGQKVGRKLKYGEETTTLRFRVPGSKKQKIIDLVNNHLGKYVKQGQTGTTGTKHATVEVNGA